MNMKTYRVTFFRKNTKRLPGGGEYVLRGFSRITMSARSYHDAVRKAMNIAGEIRAKSGGRITFSDNTILLYDRQPVVYNLAT